METKTLQAEVRPEGGKGPARQLRMRGLIPAAFYGPGTDPMGLAVAPKELLKALATEHGQNQLIELSIKAGDKVRSELAIVRELQIHPVKRSAVHVDFYRVSRDRAVKTTIPFEVKGKAAGVVNGGELHVVFRRLPILALPDRIPARITVDVTSLEVGEAIHVKDLQLPEGVSITLPSARTLVSCQMEKKRGEEEATPAAAAGATPAAGAPAAAAPAAAKAGDKAAPAAKDKKK